MTSFTGLAGEGNADVQKAVIADHSLSELCRTFLDSTSDGRINRASSEDGLRDGVHVVDRAGNGVSAHT
jgi:hypothetical protein